LRRVWKSAAQHLREAQNIIVIGYSWPSTDQLFPYLYSLGTLGGDPLERFIAVDTNAGTLQRYRDQLLGSAARERYYPLQLPFSDCAPQLQTYLKRSI
jgi:hypothetical protein